MSENNAEATVETPTVEELQASLSKAEAKIVDLKKSSTETTTEEKKEEKNETEESFGKEEVGEMIKAALKENAINNQEETFKQNQAQTNSASVTTEDPVVNSGFKALSIDEYSSLTPKAQRDYMQDSVAKTGEAQFV